MIRPTILLALGLSLLLACGRGENPSVQQVPTQPEDENAGAADEFHPPTIQHRARPKRQAGTRSKLADAMDAKRAGANPRKSTATSPAKTGDAAVPKAAGPDPVQTQSREVQMGGMRLAAPKGWTRERPPMDLILAQFSLPRAQGDSSDAQLTVAAALENDPKSLKRLREQLKEEAEEGSVEQLQIGGNEVVLVDTSGEEDAEDDADTADGTSKPSRPPGGGPRYRVLNAMVFLSGRVYFVTCAGPEKTVGERAGEFRAFLQSMKSAE